MAPLSWIRIEPCVSRRHGVPARSGKSARYLSLASPNLIDRDAVSAVQASDTVLVVFAICYVPGEFWIALITEVAQRVPKIHCP